MVEKLAEHACWGGTQGFYQHESAACAGLMRFGLFLPPQSRAGKVPVVFALAGLTCSEETFAIKAGAQRAAAELGLALAFPDTSPRSPDLPGDRDAWDFGQGAGFYVNATREPWLANYRMFSYVTEELPALVARGFPVDPHRMGIMGHSMGGHGALVAAFRRPDRFASCSAFAPISAPIDCPWGIKAFSGYLGVDRAAWAEYDASRLMAQKALASPILVDQGLADKFLAEQLMPEKLEAAAAQSGQVLRVRRHAGYDHGYFFIQSFVADHLVHHAALLATR
ncbi:MAG: S-formylglutathione hydrolase [Alphaproteobacteria bacterium]|nr:S-formylglutathione hydrolase [Alphaproteobacteria bacterium]